jgi:pyocin large subunit-like protein
MSKYTSRGPAVLALLAAAAISLSACDGGASAVRTAATDGGSGGGGKAYAATSGVDHRKDPATLLDGKPMWAANRQHSGEDNARFHFKRDGAAFGATSAEDYARIAQAFIAAPPAGSEVIKRPNGDRLIYDPRGNTFAVAASDGTPRALFKPRDGAAYWAKQKSNAQSGGGAGGKSRKGSDDSSSDG